MKLAYTNASFTHHRVTVPCVPVLLNDDLTIVEAPQRWLFYVALDRGRTRSRATWRSYAEVGIAPVRRTVLIAGVNVGAVSRLTLSGRARHVSFGEDTLIIDLEDGRQLAVPIAWFPRLAGADAAQRSNWELVGRGIGISWPDIDEDISVENLLQKDGELLMARDLGMGMERRSTWSKAGAGAKRI